MNFGKLKKLAARFKGVSPKRVKFRPQSSEDKEELKSSLTRRDIDALIEKGVIVKTPARGNSRTRANHIKEQKKKGRRKGQGSRKGKAGARQSGKDKWMIKIRALRKLLVELRANDKLSSAVYRELYLKSKGNFFRNKKHMLLYIKQNNLMKKDGSQ